MSSSKVYITDYISEQSIEKNILKENLSDQLHKDVEVLIVWHELITKHYIDNLPNLKGIVRYGVGYENVDIDHAKSKTIYVCNTPDYGVDEVSDTAIAMIMNIARGMTRYDYQCRAYQDSWQEHKIQLLKRTSECMLGVIGAGRIGGSILLKANALKFQTVFYDPFKCQGHEKMLSAQRVDSLNELLNISDIISVNTPLNSNTLGMVDSDFIRKMKKGASFINTARGKIVQDIDIFFEPLKNNSLSSVALDVLPNEPPESSKLLNAWKSRVEWLDGRLIINPHSAFYSQEAYVEMRQKAAINALRILNGEIPHNIL